MHKLSALLLCAALLMSRHVSGQFGEKSDVAFDRIDVTVNELTLNVEYAESFEQRATGLMFRKQMCGQCGMLFRYESVRMASMWMKNTYIPLDVAFADEKGIITDIIAMQPHDLTSIRSSAPVLYALEMNQGWFKENGVKVGDTLKISSTE